MIEGWHQTDYLILFENDDESVQLTEAYNISHFLPGYTIVGLIGWDDFIVRDANSQLHTVSTVPLDAKHLQPFRISVNPSALVRDERLTKKIKWYVKPVVFGGDPKIGENVQWISMQDHILAVKYWNQMYKDIRKAQRD